MFEPADVTPGSSQLVTTSNFRQSVSRVSDVDAVPRLRRSLRIIFICVGYPPFEIGGWGQLTQELNMALQNRGHQTAVLCSNYRAKTHGSEPGVHRLLQTESAVDGYYSVRDFLMQHKKREHENLRALQQVVNTFIPDFIFIHGMWNLCQAIPWQAEQIYRERVVYYMADHWPFTLNIHQQYWNSPADRASRRILKRLVGKIALAWLEQERHSRRLRFERVLCVSQAVKNALTANLHLRPESMRVVYNGINVQQFSPATVPDQPTQCKLNFALLYAGTLRPAKGVATAVEAMKILADDPTMDCVKLTIAGSGHRDYTAYLRNLVDSYGLNERVHFLDYVPRESMPDTFKRFDVLVFPTVDEEPLARVCMEAMASGLVVVGTTTGGTKELLRERETGLTFAPGDARELAAQVKRLRADPALQQRLVQAGRQEVVQHFNIDRMADEIESYFLGILGSQHDHS